MEKWSLLISGFGSLIFLLIVWSGVWKAIALWRAARNNHLGWFVALCIVNTCGILEILYIFIWGKRQDTTNPPTPPTTM